MSENIIKLPHMRTIEQIAIEFGVARHFVRQAVLCNKCVHVKAGKKYLINRDKFAEWLNTGEQPKPTPQPEVGKIRRINK